ncbi:MAG TPA: hypothetical protein VIP98_14700 [Microlunatus sp.]
MTNQATESSVATAASTTTSSPASVSDTAEPTTARGLFSPRRYLLLTAVLLLSVALILFTQQVKLWTGHEAAPISALTFGGLATLWLFSLIGIALGDAMKLSRIPVLKTFPVLGWVSLVSLVGCLSWNGFVNAIGSVDFLSLTTPILAFAGISVVDRLADLSKTSWKVAITAIFVFIGIYVGGATIAQLGLMVTG